MMHHTPLRRSLGLTGAVGLGLGSILGTGVFVSIGLAAGVAGSTVIPAIALAALLALANAMSSAQLAAAFPVSGGTYEYGHRLLHPVAGFAAGWLFLCAKTASAAAAALGFSGYLLTTFGASPDWVRPVGAAAALVATAVVFGGVQRSHRVHTAILAVTVAALGCFVLLGIPEFARAGTTHLAAGGHGPAAFLEATALMFVAYTGYGRIATLGEEVHDPRRIIPRAILITLAISASLYLAVALVAVGAAGAEVLAAATAQAAAPLEVLARGWTDRAWPRLIGLGAMTAMLGVLLNLLLGLSRVALAMGRRGDLPVAVARVDRHGVTPTVAVLLVGGAVTALAAIGSVKLAWSFSAFTVLLYYAITNLCALRLPPEHRFVPRAVAAAGLGGCLLLAGWIDGRVALAGVGVLGVGLLVRAVLCGRRTRPC